ncbi:hypothetical protein DSCA_62920 [Desulfosarcina alkanivorans]|uniref:Uncharacterized protein n=1 Tax=Desulfosarcina alkanivorans TaxID=571177 RepID=A0A5K7YRE1_9BACT|nr:hypothetical protein [Desulfosarcina alkanivorans]BBO72362.1 hypothetical protein DSCA_62920 [Desulfosarcina alkanivorans]
MKKEVRDTKDWKICGIISFSATGKAAAGMKVVARDADLFFDDDLGTAVTDDMGHYEITYSKEQFRDLFEQKPDIYLIIYDHKDRVITDTRSSVVRNAGKVEEINVQLPGGPVEEEPEIKVGPIKVNRRIFEKLEPEMVIDMAMLALKGKGDKKNLGLLEKLSPELSLEKLKKEFCLTPLVNFLSDTILVKKWPRDTLLELEDILIGYEPEVGYASHDCPNFSITYQTSGTDQPPSADVGGNITMPGTGDIVGTTTGGNGVPDYIEKVCFWLENALATYTDPPFNLRNPASGGKIPVTITGAGMNGTASRATMSMTITRECNDDLLAAISTHELMHLIQYQYEGAGTAGDWHYGILEGGAVLGEDVVFDTHNRYIVQASTSGSLANPQSSLTGAGGGYYLALFMKYITEQQSSQVGPADEPTIGVEAYRALLERFDTDGYITSAMENEIGRLPWYHGFYKFSYLDAAKLDETSSETILGNFWAACYLKEFGTPPIINGRTERRFDFMEDEEDTTWDTLFLGADTVSTLGTVSLTVDTTLNNDSSVTLSSGAGGSVQAFAARYYKVDIDSAVDTLRVDFSADAGFTRPLVQIILVESGNEVRDIIRSDRTTWSRTIANSRDGNDLDHIAIIVAGTDVGGSFSLSVQEVSPAPDVVVTRWHHVAGTAYEIDSFGWAWTWVSPDIWVDNDGNGAADSEVFFDYNNQLFIRLHNQGHVDAGGIEVNFWYQDASAGLHDAAWMQVRDTSGTVQSISGVSLAAGASDQWSVNWSPEPSGGSNHFCIRPVVSVPGDPNTDNKRCLSNFGNVITGSPYFDLSLLRRIFEDYREFRLDVIPRAGGRWFVSAADAERITKVRTKPGEGIVDNLHVRKRYKIAHVAGTAKIDPKFAAKRTCHALSQKTRIERRPDITGHYPTDPRALPPGLDNVPLITVALVVDGRVTGGFTWAIREK